ncbi:MAG: hypothetical protein Hyperionvirus11_13 [Hyperionvirus sp.]|uniref:Uncharacterized protein n=1 Tax=Hyperionvirus sp. TaxID=2487770 RepID=A0A3G5A8Y8_9VIRU|nr:MAG: hypothetical protein Hyperionvirus11_13 [Hyperionvirus sp.]
MTEIISSSKYIELNHNIYQIYAAKIIQQSLFALFTKNCSFRGIKLSYIVDLFYASFGYKPFTIEMKINFKTLTAIENMNILDYVENFIIRDNHWRPKYSSGTMSIIVLNVCIVREEFEMLSACDIGEILFNCELARFSYYV